MNTTIYVFMKIKKNMSVFLVEKNALSGAMIYKH